MNSPAVLDAVRGQPSKQSSRILHFPWRFGWDPVRRWPMAGPAIWYWLPRNGHSRLVPRCRSLSPTIAGDEETPLVIGHPVTAADSGVNVQPSIRQYLQSLNGQTFQTADGPVVVETLEPFEDRSHTEDGDLSRAWSRHQVLPPCGHSGSGLFLPGRRPHHRLLRVLCHRPRRRRRRGHRLPAPCRMGDRQSPGAMVGVGFGDAGVDRADGRLSAWRRPRDHPARGSCCCRSVGCSTSMARVRSIPAGIWSCPRSSRPCSSSFSPCPRCNGPVTRRRRSGATH